MSIYEKIQHRLDVKTEKTQPKNSAFNRLQLGKDATNLIKEKIKALQQSIHSESILGE